jgi:two-component system, OmpR family, sensor histidine kinase BaeS
LQLRLPILKKITLIILSISLGSILISGLFINFALNRQFQNYVTQSQVNREHQIVQILAEMYQDAGSWNNLAVRLNGSRRIFFGALRCITDSNGRIVLVFRFGRIPRRWNNLHSYPIKLNNRQIGTAYFGQTRVQNLLSNQDQLFRKTINHSISLSILITSIVSMLVAYLFAKQLAKPITEMNQLARNMTGGNLETRVNNLPQDELGELGGSINQLAETLQQVQELRKKMTADVAHDLRTPLATVQSHLEGMIDSVIPPSPENLESLLEEVNRLTALVNDLQAIAIADSAIQKFNQAPIDLKFFLHDMFKKIEPLFAKKGVRLELAAPLSVHIFSDRDALAKILDNLLSNALKFTPSGKKVLLQLRKSDTNAIIQIKDEGIGISEKDLPFIFERFYRTDQSRNRDSGGFGLGLTIVKETVTALGGRISATSKPGEGSTFTVYLPIIKPEV